MSAAPTDEPPSACDAEEASPEACEVDDMRAAARAAAAASPPPDAHARDVELESVRDDSAVLLRPAAASAGWLDAGTDEEGAGGGPTPSPDEPRFRRALVRAVPYLRIAAVLALLCGLVLGASVSGSAEFFALPKMRRYLRELGARAPARSFVAFVAIFCVGELLHVPGVVFILLAALTFGRWLGALAAYVGACSSVSFSFAIVRAVGGQPIGQLARAPRLRALLARLERRPLATVAACRLIFWMAPAVNYALAMSPVRAREYVLGSAAGLAPPVVAIALLFDSLLPMLERWGWV